MSVVLAYPVCGSVVDYLEQPRQPMRHLLLEAWHTPSLAHVEVWPRAQGQAPQCSQPPGRLNVMGSEWLIPRETPGAFGIVEGWPQGRSQWNRARNPESEVRP